MDNKYPRGKLCAADEGALAIKLGIKDRTVIVDFGKEVTWFGLDKQGAVAFGQAIINKANEL